MAVTKKIEIDGICLCPQGALLGGLPHHLRVGADEQSLSPAFQPVAVGGIQQLIVFPSICRAHSVLLPFNSFI